MSKVGENYSKASSVLSTGEESRVFGFTSTRDYAWNYRGENVDRTIDLKRFVAITEKKIATSDRPSV